MIPLGLLSAGECGEIVEITLGRADCAGSCQKGLEKSEVRVEDMGLRIGKRVEMLRNGGTILLRVDESRIAVARGIAMKIMVEEVRQ